MITKIFFLGLITFTNNALVLQAQQCAVKADSLKGNYTGDCKNGWADGEGIAIGVDTFSGSFTKGLPNGEGKYTWRNGSWYQGNWKQGKRNGIGTYATLNTGKDSVALITKGFWKNDKYTGQFEKPYTFELFTNNFSEFNIRKLNSVSSEITINIKSVIGGSSSLTTVEMPKPRLISITVIEGRFEQRVNDELSSKFFNNYILRQVTFPFNAILAFETNDQKKQAIRVGVQILESANWYIHAVIEN
jgi:hypothetical protein